MKAKPLPPLKYLQECFTLSEESSSGLVWRDRPASHFHSPATHRQFRNRVGKGAGTIQVNADGKQYFTVKLGGRVLKVHRIVYTLLKRKELPENVEIDHRDGNGLNNSHNNLRISHTYENQHNSRLHVDNTSGFKGVSWCKSSMRWRYNVMYRGKQHFGFAPTPEKANELCCELRQKLHKEFTNHGYEKVPLSHNAEEAFPDRDARGDPPAVLAEGNRSSALYLSVLPLWRMALHKTTGLHTFDTPSP